MPDKNVLKEIAGTPRSWQNDDGTTLLEKITEKEQEIAALRWNIKFHEAGLSLLLKERFNCEHEWNPPYKGYEHEGCSCKKCGISDIYWHSSKL